MLLSQQLEELTAKLQSLVPAERLSAIDNAIADLKASGLADRSLKAGDKAPSFVLPDGEGMLWRSPDLLRSDLLNKGPLVIVFYRGRWCAYCNTQLAALQQIHHRIAATGASLVAISPQTQKHSYMTRDMHKLRFPILSDAGNHVAREFGLVYRLSPAMQSMYESIFTRLPGYNGDSNWELPLPATYVVKPNGEITYARVNVDWRERPEPEEIIAHLGAAD